LPPFDHRASLESRMFGFVGFKAGRTVFREPLIAYPAGTTKPSRKSPSGM
jgi:hypothetical protein